MLTIFSVPNKHYKKPFGTVVNCHLEDDIQVLYIQTSYDDEAPEWLPTSLFFDKIFSQFIHDKEFSQECFRLFKKEEIGSEKILNVISDK